jgi:hypothetical protein
MKSLFGECVSDPKIKELEDRIRWLEDQIERAHRAFDYVYEKSEAHDAWIAEHEGLHLDVNEYIAAISTKVFPKQDRFWEEADKILKGKNPSPPTEATSVPVTKTAPPIAPEVQSRSDEFTHDKFCLCAACQAKVAEEARLDGERVLAETGHRKWCCCKQCLERLHEKHLLEARENSIKLGFDPDEPPPDVDPSLRERNPFANPPLPFITNSSIPKPPRKAPAHEPHCICLDCVRWRGMGKRKK